MRLPVEAPFRFGALFWDARFDRYEKAQRYEAYLFDIPCTGTNRAFGLRVTKDGKTKDEGRRHSSFVIGHSSPVFGRQEKRILLPWAV